MHGDGGLVAERPAPDLLHQFRPAEHPAGMGQQEVQQVELAAGQVDLRAAAGRDPGRRVGGQFPVGAGHLDGSAGRAARRPPAAIQHPADPQGEFPRAERFDHVVVGAVLQADHPIGYLAQRGQHDHRDRRGPADLAGTPRARPSRAASGRAPAGPGAATWPSSSPVVPSAASSTSCPSRVRYRRNTSRTVSSSSTTRTQD